MSNAIFLSISSYIPVPPITLTDFSFGRVSRVINFRIPGLNARNLLLLRVYAPRFVRADTLGARARARE